MKRFWKSIKRRRNRNYLRRRDRGLTAARRESLGGMEVLEDRVLLANNSLAELVPYAQLNEPNGQVELTLTIGSGNPADTDPVTLGFRTYPAPGSGLDPAIPQILCDGCGPVEPDYARGNHNGTPDSLVLATLLPGEHTVLVSGSNSSTGGVGFEVYLPGDSNNNGQVTDDELPEGWTSFMQMVGWGTIVTPHLLSQFGLDLSQTAYNPAHDADRDGDIDEFDMRVTTYNTRAPMVTIDLVGDSEAPIIDVNLRDDTGRDSDDGITNELAVDLAVNDQSPIASIQVSIDGGTATELLAGPVDSYADTLDLAFLETVYGGPLANTGPHTLYVGATDELGNVAPTQSLPFTLDTLAPAAPGLPDLLDTSDSGIDDTDDITSVTEPTFRVDPEDGADVELMSDMDGVVGRGTADGGPVEITTSTLSEGTHQVTATATDAAGNTSDPSDPLTVVIDTAPPAPPTFELDNVSDPEGDGLTAATPVTIEGQTEANANVALDGTAITTVAAGDGSFSLNNVPLDFGPNQYTVTVTDTAGNPSQHTETFTRNDAPVLNDPGPLQVSENASNGDVVGQVTASDTNLGAPDNDDLTYEVIGGTGQNIFSIVELTETSAQIEVADEDALDYESPNTTSYTLVVRVTDAGGDGQGGPGLSDERTITINVINEVPIIDHQQFSLSENAGIGTPVGTVQISGDTDSVTFAILDGNDDNIFGIDPATGDITVDDDANLDHEQNNQYVLTVEVSDGVNQPSATVTIDITDEVPTVDAGQQFNVSENAGNGTVVGTVQTSGDDEPLNFSITAGNDDGIFGIDASGQITIADSAALDREDAAQHDLTVQVTDGNNPSSETVTVIVDDEVPTVDPGQQFNVSENAGIGAVVGTVATSGDDDSLSFSITAGNDDGIFGIDDAGQITIADPAALDREDAAQHDLTVRVTDGNNPSTETVTVIVDDEVPTVDAGQQFNISENAGLGAAVGTVQTSGDDDSLSFSITAGNDDGIFGIDASGQITIADPAALDYEDATQHDLTVRVTDGNNPSSETVTVIVDDEVPTVDPGQQFNISENAGNGAVVGTVQTSGDDDSLSFLITAGNDDGIFGIDDAGQITIADPAALDHEDATQHDLTVQVTDGNNPSSETVTVIVDDEVPTVDPGQQFNVSENAGDGTVVGTVQTSGDDEPLSFSITAGNDDGIFGIDDAGEITVVDETLLDHERQDSYVLTVEVTDGSNPSSETVTVIVDDEIPTIDFGQQFNVSENAGIGAVVGTVQTSGDDDSISFTTSIIEGNDDGIFAIDASGQITIADPAALDHEDAAQHVLKVEVNDETNHIRNDVTVIVGDEVPTVDAGQQFNISENAGLGAVVGTVATSGDDEPLSFSITAGNDDGIFTINDSGQITIADQTALDHEDAAQHDLTVEVTDGTTPSSETVTVIVDDEAPVLEQDPQAMTIRVDSNDGDEVGIVLNTGDNDSVTFTIDSGDPTGVFAIDDDGRITLAVGGAAQLQDDGGPNPEYSLQVTATDGNTGDTSTVTIDVIVNQAPEPTDDAYPNQLTGDPPLLESDPAVSGNVITDDTGNFPPISEPGPDTDPEGDAIFIANPVVGATANGGGIYTLEANGNFTFDDPNGDFQKIALNDTDTATFDYVLEDAVGNQATATVTITITGENDLPTAINDSGANFTTDEDTPADFSVVANDTDIDTADIPLLVIDDFDDTSLKGATITKLNDTTLTYNPAGVAEFNALAADDSTTDTFTYSIRDPHGAVSNVATVTVTINGANDDPTAEDDGGVNFTTDEDTPFTTGDVRLDNGNGPDTDPDNGDTLDVVPGDPTSTNNIVVTNNNTGTFTYDPTGQFDNLAAGQQTTDQFDYDITDGNGGNDTGTVTITIIGVNDAPVLNPTAQDGPVTDEDTPVDWQVDSIAGVDITDVDNGAIIGGIAVTGHNGNGTLAYDIGGGFVDIDPTPNNAVLLPGDAQLQYTPDMRNGESVLIEFRAWDQTTGAPGDVVNTLINGGSTPFSTATDTIELEITDVNDDPIVLSPFVDITLDDGDDQPNPIPLEAADVGGTEVFFDYDDGDILDFTIVGNTNPDIVTPAIINGELVLTYSDYDPLQDRTPSDVTIRATDLAGAFVDDTIRVTVLPIDTVDVFLVAVPQPTTDFTVYVANPNAASPDPLGVGRFRLVGDDLHYTLTTLSILDLPGNPDYGDNIDDATRVEFRTDAGFAFDILTDDDLTVDHLAGLVNGVWEGNGGENFSAFRDELEAGSLYVEVEIDGGARIEKIGDTNISDTPEVVELPTSLSSVVVGENYWVEAWVQDYYPTSTGLVTVFITENYDNSLSTGNPNNVVFANPFSFEPVGVVTDADGEVKLGGGAVIGLVGTGAFARVGAFEATAIGGGIQDYTVVSDLMDRQGQPYISPDQISLTGVQVEHVAPLQFVIDTGLSDIQVDIVYNDNDNTDLALTPQGVGADNPDISGSFNVLLDDTANPSQISIAVSDLELADTGIWNPGPPEQNNATPAELATTGHMGTIDLLGGVVTRQLDVATRAPVLGDLLIPDITTNGFLDLLVGGFFPTDDASQTWTIESGAFDYVIPDFAFGRVGLDGQVLADNGSANSQLIDLGGGDYRLVLPVARTFEADMTTGRIATVNITGTIVADFDDGNPLMAGFAGPGITIEEPGPLSDTPLAVTVNRTPTPVGFNGQTHQVPGSDDWVDEWNEFYVEFWGQVNDENGVAAGYVDLAYNGDYFTATNVQLGPAVSTDSAAVIDDVQGLVSGIGGTLASPLTEPGQVTLLARVKFESTDADHVAADIGEPLDLGLEILDTQVDVDGTGLVPATNLTAPATKLFPVVYDINDSGKIGFDDFAYFAAEFQHYVIGSSSLLTKALDFDNSGRVNFRDLSFFAQNFGVSKEGTAAVQYPENFAQEWIGISQVDAIGTTEIGDLFDSVVADWQNALALDQQVEIELVVDDFGSGQLGEARILAYDETGHPAKAVVTIDDDANGQGWYSAADGNVPADRYDLETTLLHEVGHALGFTPDHSGFRSKIQIGDNNERLFMGPGFIATLDARGEHLDPDVHPYDLMNPNLDTGESKDISPMDVLMLQSAYYAAQPGSVVSSVGSPLMAAGYETSLPEMPISTAPVQVQAVSPVAPIVVERQKVTNELQPISEMRPVAEEALSTTFDTAFFDAPTFVERPLESTSSNESANPAGSRTTVRAGLLDRTFAVLDDEDTSDRWEDVTDEDAEHQDAFDEVLAAWHLLG